MFAIQSNGASEHLDYTGGSGHLSLEQLTFLLHSNNFVNRFSDFISLISLDLFDFNNLSSDCYIFTLLCTFVDILEDLNRWLKVYLPEIVQFTNSSDLLSDSTYKSNVVRTVDAVIFSNVYVKEKIDVILNAFLCLVLEDCELQVNGHNVFAEVLPPSTDSDKQSILKRCQELNNTECIIPLHWFYEHLVFEFSKQALSRRIHLLCKENYSKRFLNDVLDYKNTILVKSWTPRLFLPTSSRRLINKLLTDELVCDTFYHSRKIDIFSLVIEYPDSVSALLDLGQCMTCSPFRQDLINHLSKEVSLRLIVNFFY